MTLVKPGAREDEDKGAPLRGRQGAKTEHGLDLSRRKRARGRARERGLEGGSEGTRLSSTKGLRCNG